MSVTVIGVPLQDGVAGLTCPYVGLRYYEEKDAGLFYGRDEHTAEILGKLARDRFLAVLGSSGSGKSSLVRAGLLPELRSGMIPQAGPRWRVIEFRPGSAPLQELSAAIYTGLGVANASQLVEEGPLGIVNAVRAARLPDNTNVLVIADQFEEVFRYQREERDKGCESHAAEQCQALVRKLLDSASQSELQIYVLLVMRSDYLGECAQFHELPERISSSMYLVPRLRRDQVQEVITAPIGNNIEPALVQELLGKTGGDPDQLPRLQHLLKRIWSLAAGDRFTMEHYDAAGRWEEALAKNLEEIYSRGEVQPRACACLFQQLSEIDENNRVVRRRASLTDLVEACGPEVTAVIAAFQREGFVRAGEPIDITHECILRNWDRVKVWLRGELEARDFYREIRARCSRNAMLTGADLVTARDYVASKHYTLAWAKRYGTVNDFEDVCEFIDRSARSEQRTNRRERALRRALAVLGTLVFVAAIAFAAVLFRTVRLEEAALSQARESAKKADAASKQAAALNQALQGLLATKSAGRTNQQTSAPRQPASSSDNFTAQQLATLYNFPPQLDGRGQTIGIIELGGGYTASDLATYFKALGRPVPDIQAFGVDGAANKPGSDADQQVTGDIEIAGSVAPGARLVLYFSPNTNQGFLDAFEQASQHDPMPVISIGWGGAEQSWTKENLQAFDKALQAAAAQGITVVAAAGNNGVTDGLSGLRAVDFPASSPSVLAVGGTQITVSDGRITSETVWNDGQGGVTGGGVSNLFSRPAWQGKISLHAQAPSGRAIPDVAADASPKSGYRIYVQGRYTTMGGTSCTAPFWAGLIVLLNQGLGENIGYLNPILYQKLGPAGVFRGITQGNNSYGGVQGYSAGRGWNAVAGWGSPDGRKLLDALRNLR